jgi:hypothetical protein
MRAQNSRLDAASREGPSMHGLVALLALVVLTSACGSSLTEPPVSGVHEAVIELDGESRFDLPPLTYVDSEFEVTVYSWKGLDMGKTVDETVVSRTVDGILIEPFDDYFSEGPVTGWPTPVSRTVTVSFHEVGSHWFEIRGRAMPGYQEITKRFSIEVLPR